MSTSPPLAALKKLKPSARSKRMKNCEAAMNGVAMTTSSDVAKFAHTSSGRRKKLSPGARMVMIVTRKLSAVMIEEAPANWTATEKKVCPMGASVDSGVYAVQPSAKAPPGAKKLPIIIRPATGSSQYERAFSRGKAM